MITAPALAQVTDDDIDDARTEVNRLLEESSDLGAAVLEAYGEQAALDTEIDALRTSINLAEVRIAETEVRLAELAVELYMDSTGGSNLSVFFGASDEEYAAGLEYLKEASGVEENLIDNLRTFRTELDRQTTRLGEALEAQQIVTAELEVMSSQLQEDLVAAQEVYDQLVAQQAREEAERQRQEEERRRQEEERRRREEAARATTTTAPPTATSTQPSATTPTTQAGTATTQAPTTTSPPTTTTTTPPSSGGGACPVAGAVRFTDTWGAPRSGGRTHKGVDMIAARGVPIVAIYSGYVQRTSNSSLGGLSVYLISDAGDMYYYAHLDSFGDIKAGQQVPEGYVLGYNGSTGNAPDYLPHLHFEYHPGGGAAVNPYPLVKSICG